MFSIKFPKPRFLLIRTHVAWVFLLLIHHRYGHWYPSDSNKATVCLKEVGKESFFRWAQGFLLFAITSRLNIWFLYTFPLSLAYALRFCGVFLAQYLSRMTHFRVGPNFYFVECCYPCSVLGGSKERLSAPNWPSHVQMNFRHVKNFSQETQGLAHLEQIPQPSVLFVPQCTHQATNRASEHTTVKQHWA